MKEKNSLKNTYNKIECSISHLTGKMQSQFTIVFFLFVCPVLNFHFGTKISHGIILVRKKIVPSQCCFLFDLVVSQMFESKYSCRLEKCDFLSWGGTHWILTFSLCISTPYRSTQKKIPKKCGIFFLNPWSELCCHEFNFFNPWLEHY